MGTILDELPVAWGAVQIANDQMQVTVLTGKGADIFSIIDVRTGIDVLFKAPWGIRAASGVSALSTSAERWLDAYPGGWQVILPNGGDECMQYGVTWGFHGEAAMIPWRILARSESSITLEARLVTAPLLIHRHVTIEGAVLRVHETVTNASSQAVEVMWSHHPAFGSPFIDSSCVVSAGCATLIADDVAPGTILESASSFSWPHALDVDGRPVDFSRVPPLNEPRSVLAYLDDFEAGYFAITNTRLGLGVGVRWPLEIFNKAWLWQEMNAMAGWPWFQQAYVMAIEPASTIPGQGMATARAKGYDGIVFAPGEQKDVLIELVLFEGEGEIVGIDAGGVVKWATSS